MSAGIRSMKILRDLKLRQRRMMEINPLNQTQKY
jgi:hypothetical protein